MPRPGALRDGRTFLSPKIHSFDRARIHAAIDAIVFSLPPRDPRAAALESLYHDLERARIGVDRVALMYEQLGLLQGKKTEHKSIEGSEP
jgi:hypothetical protein